LTFPQGAAYGFSTIAAQAQEQLAPYLPTIVPRLYRYKYDPNPRVQEAMSNIWTAVVPESNKAIDRYLPAIMEDLVLNLNSALWRNRQSRWVKLVGGVWGL
jgi:proteasome component ECM29